MMAIRDHLVERHLNPNDYNVIIDDEKQIATFMLWDLSGRLVGYQQYNPAGTKSIRNDEKHRDSLKYFTFVGDEGDKKKKLCAWGFESFHLNERIMFITEGIFDAVKLHNAGYPALAVVSNDPKHLKPLLQALGRVVIAVCDDDDAGKRLGKCASLSLTVPKPFHDLGDMSQDDVNAWLMNIMNELTAKHVRR